MYKFCWARTTSHLQNDNMTQRQLSNSQGNTRPSKYRRWAFTLNSYNEEEPWRKAEELAEQKTIKYLVAGREIEPSTGTRHLQDTLNISTVVAFKERQGTYTLSLRAMYT